MKEQSKYIELNKSKHELVATGIIKVKVNEGDFIEVEDVKVMHQANLELSKGNSFCILLDTSMGYFNTSSEARDLVASEEYAQIMKATAIVVNTLATQLAGNFFIRLNKPKAPTKLFTDEAAAIQWLEEFTR